MWRAITRDMRAHPGRMAMTLIAIVLGVGFVVATWVVSDSAAKTVAGGSSRSDVAVKVSGKDLSLSTLAALPGVTGVKGVVTGYSVLVGADGKVAGVSFPDLGGTNWDGGSSRFVLVQGRGPATEGEVALEETTAKEGGIHLGETARLLNADATTTRATVVGLYTYRRLGAEDTVPAAAFDSATAWRAFGQTYAWAELQGTDQAAIAAAARAGGYEAQTGTELARALEQVAAEDAKLVRNFLLAFASVALVAGMFVIANTFTMLVAQRSRHFALLRAVGARRRQVRHAIVGEAALLGLTGAVIGSVVGVALGWLMLRLIRSTGETIVFAVSPWGILIGLAVGVLVTVAAAYGSARRGAAVSPVAALRADVSLPRRSLVIRTVAGLVFIVTGLIAVTATSGSQLTDTKRVVGIGGAMVAWLGVLCLAPLLAMGFLRPLSALARGAVTRLALRNAIRDPLRTAATASALMIGLALVTAFATVGTSLEAAQTAAVRADVPPGTIAVQSVQRWFDMPAAVADRVRAMSPGVVAEPIAGEGTVTAAGNTFSSSVTAIERAAIGTVVTPKVDLSRGFAVAKEVAVQYGLKAGDQITVQVEGNEPVVGTVGSIYERSYVLRGVVIDKALLSAGLKGYPVGMFVRGVEEKALNAALADRPDVLVRNQSALIAADSANLRLALGIVTSLLAAAVVIAIFGVVNTLALSVLERTREIGVFRAVGATRKLVRRSVRRESIVIASYGGVLGTGVGVLLGAVMQHVIIGAPIFSLTVPWLIVCGAMGAMVVVGVVAAAWPAHRASRTAVLNAIAAP